jgi:hypothetical protein
MKILIVLLLMGLWPHVGTYATFAIAHSTHIKLMVGTRVPTAKQGRKANQINFSMKLGIT